MRYALLALSLTACIPNYEHGPTGVERVVVLESSSTADRSTVGVGLTMDGSIAVTPVSVPATYVVTFRWQGEKVSIDDWRLWKVTDTGDTLLVWSHDLYILDAKVGGKKLYRRLRDSVTALHPKGSGV